MKLYKLVALAMMTTLSSTVWATDPIDVNYEMQRLDARHRLFKTTNVWNFLELDTQTGKVWQVQFSVGAIDSRMKIEVSPEMARGGTKSGRFTLYPTRNNYNFILLDQDSGKTWQVQWSTEKDQGSWPIDQKSEKTESSWKQ